MGNQTLCCYEAEVSRSEVPERQDKVDKDQPAINKEPPAQPSIKEPAAPAKVEETPVVTPLAPIAEGPKLPVQEPAPNAQDVASAASKQQQAEVPWMQQLWNNYTSGNMGAKEKAFLADKVTTQPRRPSTLKIGLPEYANKHAGIFDKLRALEANDGWTLKKAVGSVEIYTKSVPGEDMLYTKGVTTMKTHGNGIRHLVAHLLMAEDRPKYDEMCSFGQTVESYLPYYRIVYFKMISPAVFIASRDVLSLSRIIFEKDGSLLIATESTENPLLPEKPPYVRCLIMGGYVIRPTSDPDTYQVIFTVRSDPRGWLPGWVKSLIAWKVQLVLVGFKKYYDDTFGKSTG